MDAIEYIYSYSAVKEQETDYQAALWLDSYFFLTKESDTKKTTELIRCDLF